MVLPAIVTLKSGLYERSNLITYSRCTLGRESLLPHQILGFVSFDLGRVYFEKKLYDSSLYFMQSALQRFKISGMRKQDKQFLVSYIEDKIRIVEGKLE